MSLSEQIENTVDKILDDCIDFEKNMETSTYRGRIVRFLWEENNIDMYERFQDSTKTQLLEYKPMISDEIKLEIWFILTWIGYDLENGK